LLRGDKIGSGGDVNMSKPFAVKFRGIDGTVTKRFATLAGAAKYVKDRYLGSDYVRGSNELQDEFGYYVFTGFTWADLGKRVTNDDGYHEFRWFKVFGGDLDPDLDPTATGRYKICSVHPHCHPSFDYYVIGTSYKIITRADSLVEVRRKMNKLYEELGDDGPDEFSPYEVFDDKHNRVYLPFEIEACEQLDKIKDGKCPSNPDCPVHQERLDDATIPF